MQVATPPWQLCKTDLFCCSLNRTAEWTGQNGSNFHNRDKIATLPWKHSTKLGLITTVHQFNLGWISCKPNVARFLRIQALFFGGRPSSTMNPAVKFFSHLWSKYLFANSSANKSQRTSWGKTNSSGKLLHLARLFYFFSGFNEIIIKKLRRVWWCTFQTTHFLHLPKL